jgi:hypothetical protein
VASSVSRELCLTRNLGLGAHNEIGSPPTAPTNSPPYSGQAVESKDRRRRNAASTWLLLVSLELCLTRNLGLGAHNEIGSPPTAPTNSPYSGQAVESKDRRRR